MWCKPKVYVLKNDKLFVYIAPQPICVPHAWQTWDTRVKTQKNIGKQSIWSKIGLLLRRNIACFNSCHATRYLQGKRWGCETGGPRGEGEGAERQSPMRVRGERTTDACAVRAKHDTTRNDARATHCATPCTNTKIYPHYSDFVNETFVLVIVFDCSLHQCPRRLWEFFSLFDTHMTWITVRGSDARSTR